MAQGKSGSRLISIRVSRDYSVCFRLWKENVGNSKDIEKNMSQ